VALRGLPEIAIDLYDPQAVMAWMEENRALHNKVWKNGKRPNPRDVDRRIRDKMSDRSRRELQSEHTEAMMRHEEERTLFERGVQAYREREAIRETLKSYAKSLDEDHPDRKRVRMVLNDLNKLEMRLNRLRRMLGRFHEQQKNNGRGHRNGMMPHEPPPHEGPPHGGHPGYEGYYDPPPDQWNGQNGNRGGRPPRGPGRSNDEWKDVPPQRPSASGSTQQMMLEELRALRQKIVQQDKELERLRRELRELKAPEDSSE
jgi:dynactin complex subunit